MVARLQKPLRDAVFVDLDGTLLKANSMKLFMRWLPKRLIRKNRPFSAAAAVFWIAFRGLHLISHKRMKWHLTSIGHRRLSATDWNSFTQSLVPHINTKVVEYIESRRKKGAIIIIASAAPEEYTSLLAGLMDYDGVAATTYSPTLSGYKELRGERKRIKINELQEKMYLRLVDFLTDHTDDLPTTRQYPGQTIIVNASPDTRHEFKLAGVSRFLP